MTALTPAVRAALFLAALVVVVGVVGASLHLSRVDAEAERASARNVETRAVTLAAALATSDSKTQVQARFEQIAAQRWSVALALMDADGSVLTATESALTGASPWTAIAASPGVRVTTRGGTRYAAFSSPIGESGLRLGVAQIIRPTGGTWTALGVAFALVALALGGVAGLAWYAGPRAATILGVTSERMAANYEGDPRTQTEAAERMLGGLAAGLRPLAGRLLESRADLADASRQVAALLQINPHYVLIATMDGHLIEANPAFYAATGLVPASLRGSHADVLREVFPLEPLLELADRSDREGASIQGIEYGLVDEDGRSLPVLVSLRAVRVRGQKAVLIQATDVAAQKRLERQVAAFSDTLELMVDQRVAALTAGKSTLRLLLDRAGIVLASFDASGGTVRWNGAAETFTGYDKTEASHFHVALAALGLSEEDRGPFSAWFWGDVPTPFVANSTFRLDGGGARSHRMVWRTAPGLSPGQSDRRTLVGVEVPESLPVGAFVPDASIPVPPPPGEAPPRETGLPTYDQAPEDAPSAEAIAEEEAWIRRLASEGPDAFGGAGAFSRDTRASVPGGGTWISGGGAPPSHLGDGQ